MLLSPTAVVVTSEAVSVVVVSEVIVLSEVAVLVAVDISGVVVVSGVLVVVEVEFTDATEVVVVSVVEDEGVGVVELSAGGVVL